jgi:hypothetical protein
VTAVLMSNDMGGYRLQGIIQGIIHI